MHARSTMHSQTHLSQRLQPHTAPTSMHVVPFRCRLPGTAQSGAPITAHRCAHLARQPSAPRKPPLHPGVRTRALLRAPTAPASTPQTLRLHLSTVSRPPLTLFPKCFSSFPHGTCSLSVSCPYLALDDAYHPFQAAFPNNPTRQSHLPSP